MNIETAIHSRHSVRAFRPDPVPQTLIEEILASASRAPSGTNIQPWRVWVVTGPALKRLSAAILTEVDRHADEPSGEYRYYPDCWRSPYLERRRRLGWELYRLLGIARGEKQKMRAQQRRNFSFFDAPAGLLFTIDRDLNRGSWLDYGMFLQTLMLAARGHGLDSCPQASFIHYHQVIRAQLQIPDEQMLVCGMSLGYADPEAAVNRLRSEREPVESFARFIDT